MTAPVRLIKLGEVASLRSQALYHGLAAASSRETPDTLVLCRPDRPYFSVGYHQDPAQELDLDFCRANGYPVLHRKIGGGTVYLDRHQLFYQVVVHGSRAPLRVEDIYRTFLAAPVAALRALGLPAGLVGANEIEVRGRRIAGTGGGQIGEAVVVTGNLLFDFPFDLMARAWRVPSEAFRRLADETLRRSLTTLRRELALVPEVDDVADLLVRHYQQTLGRPLVPGALTRAEGETVAGAEAQLRAPAPREEVLVQPRRALKIARGIYVREGEEGPWLERRGPEPPGFDAPAREARP